jgi:hypothetical protein
MPSAGGCGCSVAPRPASPLVGGRTVTNSDPVRGSLPVEGSVVAETNQLSWQDAGIVVAYRHG